MSNPGDARAREKMEEALSRLASAARSFGGKARGQAGLDLRELIDPDGESIASIVDVERSAGAAALALPIDLITFESWVLGHLGDRDELDLDVNTHQEVFFGLGAWIGETLRERHGGFWLLVGDDPRAWRIGFSKVLLEIAPHAFAEKLLRSGQGMGRRLVGEVERIRVTHETAAEAAGGKLKEKFGPPHYARLHTVPLAQWLLMDMATIQVAWSKKGAGELRTLIADGGKRLPPQNQPILAKIDESLGKLDPAKPAAEQVKDRGLFEAIAQVVALRKVSTPLAVDVVEKMVFPALHIGAPTTFPDLGDDDVANVKKGTDLFTVFIDVVPYMHQAEEKGFLGVFAPTDMSTPYPDRLNLELAKGDWVIINPTRLVKMLQGFDPAKLIASYEKFVEHVAAHPQIDRRKLTEGRQLAETAARAGAELRALVGMIQKGQALIFRLLPPP